MSFYKIDVQDSSRIFMANKDGILERARIFLCYYLVGVVPSDLI